jgi:hypothetical protein
MPASSISSNARGDDADEDAQNGIREVVAPIEIGEHGARLDRKRNREKRAHRAGSCRQPQIPA